MTAPVATTTTSTPANTVLPAGTEEKPLPVRSGPKFFDVPLSLKKAGIPAPGSVIRFVNDSSVRMTQPGHKPVQHDGDTPEQSWWSVAAGTSATIIRAICNTDQSSIFVSLELLTQDSTGAVVNAWYPVMESQKFKEWDWMVPPMRLKMIQTNFEQAFEVIIAA